MTKSLLFFGVTVVSGVVLFGFQSGIQAFFSFDKAQQLEIPDPEVYRKWELVGTGAVPNDQNRGRAIFPGVHIVFIDPVSIKHRRESGFFPDGTIIVMENFHQNNREGVSGKGYFESGPRDLLVSIKDRRIFPASGWSYYFFSDMDIKNGVKSSAARPKSDCQACHIAEGDDDQVFVSFYPQLKKVKRPDKTPE